MGKKDNIRIPKQKRSKALTEHIIKTAMGLFAEKGYYSVTSHNIADAAEISIGSFYSYFSDKKQVLLAVLSEYMEQVNQTLPKEDEVLAIGEVPTHEVLKKWIERILDAHRIKSGLDKQITILALDDPDVAEIMRKQEIKQIHFIERLLQHYLKREYSATDIRATAYVINNSIEKNIHSLAYSEPLIQEENILEALSDMICHYISGLNGNFEKSVTYDGQ